jgi:hypothetical protein
MGFEALARFGMGCYQLGMKWPYLVDDKSFIFLMTGAKLPHGDKRGFSLGEGPQDRY